MKKISSSFIVTLGLAVFSMLIGAGNLIFPLLAGMQSGNKTPIAMVGFFITAVFLPIIGLITMILFDGNYEVFFKRLGTIPGHLFIFTSMIILGPLICIPRIATLSHEMIAPFIPWHFLSVITPLSAGVFSTIFFISTFLVTYRKNKIVEILGNIISPMLIISLTFIFVKGIMNAQKIAVNTNTNVEVFKQNILLGYQTLDLIGALFYASIVLNILKKTLDPEILRKPRILVWISLKAGIIGGILLGLVYIGMGFIGAYHGHGFEDINAAELFREISFKVLDSHGAAIIAIATLMACLSTAIAICAVLAEYIRTTLSNKTISFALALALVLIACMPLSIAGFEQVATLTAGPITYIGYPMLITITLCNLGYKLFDFKPIKIPVITTFIVTLISYLS
ncbi:MAG: branched-chain amino acid transport system II carrier protein [Candidatus Babeliales bacterium]|nr:branched-chain amino acid transport system II carrier protein [Candidatus Babeliales bacterium]